MLYKCFLGDEMQDDKHILDVPVLRSIFHFISWLFVKFTGWKIIGEVPDVPKMIAIAAPHTSNWDFPVFMSMVGLLRLRVRYLGKHTLFKPPFGAVFRLLGGTPVERGTAQASDVFQAAVKLVGEKDRIILGLAPEGTRSGDGGWKTGFYRIAVETGVPILIAYLDAPRKEVGVHGLFYPTGDMQADIASIRAIYAGKTGIKPPTA